MQSRSSYWFLFEAFQALVYQRLEDSSSPMFGYLSLQKVAH
jgi:hypothetical protein